MKEVFIADKKDFAEVTEFINGVFNKKFPEFMEKVYTEDNFMNAEHYCIRDERGLAACVAVYPQVIRCGDKTVECAWIGSVSVAGDRRGMGYMKQLMSYVGETLSNRKIPFSYLSGRRNRYGFFGYEIAGIRNVFKFEEENIRLTAGFDACKDFSFERMEESDAETVESVMEMHRRRFFTARAEKDMIIVLKTWGHTPYVIKKSGKVIGYLTVNNEGDIAEIEVLNGEEYLYVCGAFMKHFGYEEFSIEARNWETEKCRVLAEICECYGVETLCNMRIFDCMKTLEFFVEAERKIRKLMPGRLTVKAEGEDAFFVEVSENAVKTGRVCGENADISLTRSQLIRLCFTKGSDYITGFDNTLVKNWFPLSYTPERVDEF